MRIDARGRTFSFDEARGEPHPLASFDKLIKRKHAAQEPYPQSRPVEPPHRILWMILCALMMFALIFGTVYLLKSRQQKRLWRRDASYRKINFGAYARAAELHACGAGIFPAEQRKKT